MNIAPIIAMNGILVILTILLLIADKLLVSYGECKITVRRGDEKQNSLILLQGLMVKI